MSAEVPETSGVVKNVSVRQWGLTPPAERGNGRREVGAEPTHLLKISPGEVGDGGRAVRGQKLGGCGGAGGL